MLSLFNNWEGSVSVNGCTYNSIHEVTTDGINVLDPVSIVLLPKQKKAVQAVVNGGKTVYKISVKRYMTQKSNPGFEFMAKWNNDNPMPLRTMVGTIEKETRGMVYMKLHGDIYAEKIHFCMKCGKVITNPVSQYFGMGPECGGHNYKNPFNSTEELNKAVESYKKELQKITWEGWIIKSALTEQEELD